MTRTEPIPGVRGTSSHEPMLDRVLRHSGKIRAIVTAHGGSNPRLFGSVARGEDGQTSDVDIIVDHRPRLSLLGLASIQEELEHLLGVEVDLTVDNTIPDGERGAIDAQAISL